MDQKSNYDAELQANTSEIVAAFISKNSCRPDEVPQLIKSIREALRGDGTANGEAAAPVAEVFKPAVPVKKSITPDHLISLIDGKQYKSLKRHLTTHGLTPETYRDRYGLSPDYPMVSENYSKQRAALAAQTGLGKKGRGAE